MSGSTALFTTYEPLTSAASPAVAALESALKYVPPIPGKQLTDVKLPALASVVRRFEKGELPPLFYLTDSYCARGSVAAARDLDDEVNFKTSSSSMVHVSKPLNFDVDRKLTFPPWFQAYGRFIPLVERFFPSTVAAWRSHYNRILAYPNHDENWPRLVRYDAEVRRHAASGSGLDPSVWQTFIWEQESARYTAELFTETAKATMEKSVAKGRFHPYGESSGSGRNHSFRASESRASPPPAGSKASGKSARARCFKCGAREPSHNPHDCKEMSFPSGGETLLVYRSTPSRVDANGERYCFAWNSKGCSDKNCTRGKHSCTLCGDERHTAQKCDRV
ncbi:hypothetical protein C8F01DRAFT_1248005 [Mycena amicta]|nr:hypothetical protein C8F01DRAFT_1248005 [Mycena amicta]